MFLLLFIYFYLRIALIIQVSEVRLSLMVKMAMLQWVTEKHHKALTLQ